MQSANDAANSASIAEGGGGVSSFAHLAATTVACADSNGTLTQTTTTTSPNTVVHNYQYTNCQIRDGVVWNGNRTITVQNPSSHNRTFTMLSNLIESFSTGTAAGQTLAVTTDPNVPMVLNANGLKADGTVLRTRVSRAETRLRTNAAGTPIYHVYINYNGLSTTDTYASNPNNYTLTNRVLDGPSASQTVHHLIWKVMTTNTFSGVTWTPPSCACTPISGSIEHRFVWDNINRVVDVTRTFNSCGNSTLTGSDVTTNANPVVNFTITDACN